MAFKIYLYDNDQDCIGAGCLSSSYIQFQLEAAAGQDVEVHISSVGGSAFDAIAIYDLFKKYPGKLTTHVDALAASAASIVAMAGQTVHMSKYGILMIHKPMVGSNGNADDLLKDANMLNVVQTRLAAIYMDKTGLDETAVNGLINSVTWMTAEQALELKFIDQIEDYSETESVVKNAALITNYIQTAPEQHKKVLNTILVHKNPIEMATVTKEEIEESAKVTNNLLKRIINFFTPQITKVVTNKGEKFIIGNLVEGAPIFNDATGDTDAEDDADVEATDKDGKKVKMSIVAGKISNIKKDEEESADADGDDDDFEADNKVVLNQVGINFKKVNNVVDHKSIKNALAVKLKEVSNKVDVQNALIVDLKSQLSASNALVQRSETEVKNQILSEFVPNTSKRSTKPGEVKQAASFVPQEGTYAANAAKMAVNKSNAK